MKPEITRLDSRQAGFREALEKLLAWESVSDDAVVDATAEILEAVRTGGDRALLEYSRRFDAVEAASVAELEIPLARLERAHAEIGAADREALELAAARIRAYAERQKLDSWQYT